MIKKQNMSKKKKKSNFLARNYRMQTIEFLEFFICLLINIQAWKSIHKILE